MSHAELIETFIKTRSAQDIAKAALDDERAKLHPFEDALNDAKKQHATAKEELSDALGAPGEKFTTDNGTASLSTPSQRIVREVDMAALLEWAKQQHPRVVERYTNDVDKTPAPRLTVKGK